MKVAKMTYIMIQDLIKMMANKNIQCKENKQHNNINKKITTAGDLWTT